LIDSKIKGFQLGHSNAIDRYPLNYSLTFTDPLKFIEHILCAEWV
jgi:hypothetical protein